MKKQISILFFFLSIAFLANAQNRPYTFQADSFLFTKPNGGYATVRINGILKVHHLPAATGGELNVVWDNTTMQFKSSTTAGNAIVDTLKLSTWGRLYKTIDSMKVVNDAIYSYTAGNGLTLSLQRFKVDTSIIETKAYSLNYFNILTAANGLQDLAISNHTSQISTHTTQISTLNSSVPFLASSNTFSAFNTFTKDVLLNSSQPKVKLTNSTSGNDASIYRTETNNEFFVKNKVYEVGGAASNGIYFNSSTQYLEANPTNITGISAVSISIWIYTGSSNENKGIMYIGNGTKAYNFLTVAGNLYVQNNQTTPLQSASTLINNSWNHIVVTISSSGVIKYYKNGALVTTGASNVPAMLSSITKIRVGNSNGLPDANSAGYANDPFLNRQFDQLLIYNTELSLANVQAIYNSSTGTSSPPLTSNLLGRWEFNEGTGNLVDDVSTYSNDITLVNSPIWAISTGKIPTDAAIQEGRIMYVRDGVNNGERGQYHFGDPFGGTILRGRTIKWLNDAETYYPLCITPNGFLLNPTNTSSTATAASTVSVVGNASIGSNTAAPTNGLTVAGESVFTGVRKGYVDKSANYTLTAADYFINATVSGITFTFPTAVGIAGREYVIINSSSGDITANTTSSQTIGNYTTTTSVTIPSNATYVFAASGTGYKVISIKL